MANQAKDTGNSVLRMAEALAPTISERAAEG